MGFSSATGNISPPPNGGPKKSKEGFSDHQIKRSREKGESYLLDQHYASSQSIQDEETRTDEVVDDHAGAVCVRLIIELNLEITIVGWELLVS